MEEKINNKNTVYGINDLEAKENDIISRLEGYSYSQAKYILNRVLEKIESAAIVSLLSHPKE